MKIKILLGSFFALSFAHAKVPYPEIEAFRRQTVVIRVPSDNPQSPGTKKCNLKIDFAHMGAKLELSQENFSKMWAKVTISTEDLAGLDTKTQDCLSRASCQAYETFVSAAKVDPTIQQEVELLKDSLKKKTAQMTAKTYVKAWGTIPKPCEVLRQILK